MSVRIVEKKRLSSKRSHCPAAWFIVYQGLDYISRWICLDTISEWKCTFICRPILGESLSLTVVSIPKARVLDLNKILVNRSSKKWLSYFSQTISDKICRESLEKVHNYQNIPLPPISKLLPGSQHCHSTDTGRRVKINNFDIYFVWDCK